MRRNYEDEARRAFSTLDTWVADVTELVEAFKISQPSISEHLRILRDAGLVLPRKTGRQRIYRLETMSMKELADWVDEFERLWTGRMDDLGD